MPVEPGNRPGNVIENDFFCDEKIKFIYIEFMVDNLVKASQ
jgi:hypothetical protein